MQEISLEEALLKVQQVEVIIRMIERYNEEMDNNNIFVIAGLLKKLSGDVASWLITEERRGEQ
ncbi:hypothetical protein HEL69_016435 [Escherichia coli]|uniref:hypothetical protein n=1 Tax=Escherichia coli TaxID=562 RepID=UPI000BE39D86|nr:hypothetical protein [Escherichia coli]MBB7851698.1 hypothetical protein [Escherichia coli]